MSSEIKKSEEMNVFDKIIGIFSSPTETMEALNKKPTWLVPFIILVIVITASQFITMDININDQMEAMKSRGMSGEQLEMATERMQGPLKYIGFGLAPIGLMIVWLALAGILLFTGNIIMGGKAKFKNIFSLVAWSGMIGIISTALTTYLITVKGTRAGVTTSLALLLPAPLLGENQTIIYRILSQFDAFSIWTLFIWVVGLSVIYRFSMKKSAMMVLSLWVIFSVFVVGIGALLGNMF